MLSNFRNKKTVVKSSVFKFKEDIKVSKSYDDMDEEGIEKAFRELLNDYLDKDYLQADVESGTSLEYKRELLRGGSLTRPLLSKTTLGQIVQNPDYLTSDKRTNSFIANIKQYIFALSYSTHECTLRALTDGDYASLQQIVSSVCAAKDKSERLWSLYSLICDLIEVLGDKKQCFEILLSEKTMLCTLINSVFQNNRHWKPVTRSSDSLSDEIPIRVVPVASEAAVLNLLISFYTLSSDMRKVLSAQTSESHKHPQLVDSWLDTMENLAWDLYREYVTIRGRSRLLLHGFSSGKKRAILGQSMEAGEYAASIHCMVLHCTLLRMIICREQKGLFPETQTRTLSSDPKVVRIVHKLFQIRNRELTSCLIELSRLGVKLPVSKNASPI